jgi:predicted phage tail protein
LDTDIFRIIGGSSNNLYKIINDKKYLISSHDGHDYIRLASVKPSQSQLDEWISRLGTLSIPDTQPATAPPQDTIEISIDDFRNVGRRQYRISSVVESEYGQYEVNASEYNREKFSIIENEISLNRPTLPIPPQVSMEIPLPPKDFAVKDTTYRGVITNV